MHQALDIGFIQYNIKVSDCCRSELKKHVSNVLTHDQALATTLHCERMPSRIRLYMKRPFAAELHETHSAP